MSYPIQVFIQEYAAVFAGAGLFRASGYVDWKGLLQSFAKGISPNVEKEYDLLSVAQYYYNTYRNRGSINQAIIKAFTKDTMENENICILTRLPITTYWTTNYDRLLEQGLERNHRKHDIKIAVESLAVNVFGNKNGKKNTGCGWNARRI